MSRLFGISAPDFTTFFSVPLILGLIAFAASIIPARQPGGSHDRVARGIAMISQSREFGYDQSMNSG